LTNQRVALVHCLFELSDSFNKIMGLSERLWSEFGVIFALLTVNIYLYRHMILKNMRSRYVKQTNMLEEILQQLGQLIHQSKMMMTISAQEKKARNSLK